MNLPFKAEAVLTSIELLNTACSLKVSWPVILFRCFLKNRIHRDKHGHLIAIHLHYILLSLSIKLSNALLIHLREHEQLFKQQIVTQLDIRDDSWQVYGHISIQKLTTILFVWSIYDLLLSNSCNIVLTKRQRMRLLRRRRNFSGQRLRISG